MSLPNCYAVNDVLGHFPMSDPADVAERLQHATFVSEENRYLYFEMPKAACSAVKLLLLKLEQHEVPKFDVAGAENRRDTRRDMMVHARKRLRIKSLVDFDDEKQREILGSPNFLRFLVVRNPYARLVSAWRNKVVVCEPGYQHIYKQVRGTLQGSESRDPVTFHEFVDYLKGQNLDLCNVHWRRQASHAFLPAMNFNFIAKTESIGDLLNRLQQHMGLEKRPELPARNVSGSPCDPMMTQAIADQIQSLYAGDFEGFRYDPNDWPIYKPAEFVGIDVFHDEIVERNIIIDALCGEIARLKAELVQSEHHPQSTRLKSILKRVPRKLGSLIRESDN
jgi:hypothetical protein